MAVAISPAVNPPVGAPGTPPALPPIASDIISSSGISGIGMIGASNGISGAGPTVTVPPVVIIPSTDIGC